MTITSDSKIDADTITGDHDTYSHFGKCPPFLNASAESTEYRIFWYLFRYYNFIITGSFGNDLSFYLF